MKYKNFTQYVDSFSKFGERQATVTKLFIKTNRQTYSQLQKQSYKSANYLLDQGVKKGDRVMIIAPNSPQWQELNLGCQLIGAILVPVDARNNLETALNFARQSGPKLLFRSEHLLSKLDKKLMKAKHIEAYDELIKDYSSKKPNIRLSGDEPSVIIFTSGTTAEPKGVVLSQQNLLSNVDGLDRAIEINPDWRILSVLPLSHSYEYIGELCMMARGVSIFYIPRITPLAIVKAMNEYKITTLLAVPQLLVLFKQRIMQTAAVEGQEKVLKFAQKIAPALPKKARRLLFSKVHKKLGGCLDLVVTGGAPIPIDVGKFWENMGVRALQGYGLTETAPILTVNKLKGKFIDSQGQALYNVELKVAEDGEILAKGPNIFNGYWQNKSKTEEVFTADGWFKTGDVGKIENGWLKIQGRAKFMMVLPSGMNVFPEDIELVAEKHPAIKEICVVGIKQEDGESVFAAVVSDKKDKAIDRAIKEINEKLEDYQHISHWARWPEEAFPRTLILKIDRKNVQAWANQKKSVEDKQKDGSRVSTDPIVNILRLSLDNPKALINEKDTLSELGVDSLRRLAVVSMIEEQLGAVVSESAISKTTTVAELRKLVTSSGHQGPMAKRATWQYRKIARFLGNCMRETFVRLLLACCTKIKVVGINNLDELDTSAIFIFNHVDNLDAMVVYQSLPANVRKKLTAAQAEDFLHDHPFIKIFARLNYASFNFSRTDNIMSGLEYTANRLENGWHVLMAPEGTITPNGRLQAFKTGIGLLAVETGAPVVPVKIEGLYGTLPLHGKFPKKYSRVTVKIGKPVKFEPKKSYQKATKQLYKTIKKL